MYEPGKCANVAREMKNYQLEILGISETRWTDAGKTILTTGETIIYSGNNGQNPHHTRGVGIMMTSRAAKSLIGWEPVNERIILARFRTSHSRVTLTVITCYAPTNEADEETKEEFYEILQNIMNKRSEREVVLLIGDFNAKVGNDNTGYRVTMGRHGVGTMNENGQHLTDFCANNNLAIGGTLFPHKEIHKTTWESPDKKTHNQIDHICINTKFRRSLLDVRVKRGADAASDHHLVVGKLQLKLRKHDNVRVRWKYNVESLQDKTTQQNYQQKIITTIHDLRREEGTTIEDKWNMAKEAFITSLEESVGRKKKKNKPWIKQSTLDAMDERKILNEKLLNARTRSETTRLQSEYTDKHKEVKRRVKEDKIKYVEELAKEAEEAAEHRNMKELYNITRTLSGKKNAPEKPVRDKSGSIQTTVEEQKDRWKEHFEELLNRPSPEIEAQIPPAEQELNISLEPPSKEEIRKAIKTLNSGKSGGPDCIPAEALKYAVEPSVTILHPLLHQIWEEENIPEDWKEGYIIKLPKKGDLSLCKNYRGIMLLSTPGKVLNRILLNRMKASVDQHLREHQAGFRKDRSCPDQIASLRIIIEQSLEWKSPLYINFVDFEKAFDSVDRDSLWKIMRHYGIPNKYISIVKATYDGMTCRVLHGGDVTEQFQVLTGVRQGCILSPLLFLMAIDWVMKETTWGKKNGIQWSLLEQLDDLDFADDLALLSHKHSQMQDKTSTLESIASSIGLRINREKTKVMRINTNNIEPIVLQDGELDEVTEFTYLGSVVDTSGGTDKDIKVRIGKARTAFNMLKKVWNAGEISKSTKIRIFNSNVKSVLFYGAETWRTTVASDKKIQSFINRCLRRIQRIFWPNRIRNNELWQVTKQLPPPMQIRKRKWTWIGHTLRKGPGNITKQSLQWNPQGKRARGRPRNSWRRSTTDEMTKAGYTWHDLVRNAQNRVRWRTIVSGLCSSQE